MASVCLLFLLTLFILLAYIKSSEDESTVTLFTVNNQKYSAVLNESNPLTARCQVDPEGDIVISRNSKTLLRDTHSTTAEYTKKSVCSDSGNYNCRVGTTSSVNLSVLVTCTPRLDPRYGLQSTFITVVGGNVTFNIPVIASPLPTFYWYRIFPDKTIKLSSYPAQSTDIYSRGIYEVINVKKTDMGLYQVVVSNGVGPSDLVVNLTVFLEVSDASSETDNSVMMYGTAVIVILILIAICFALTCPGRKKNHTKSAEGASYSPVWYDNAEEDDNVIAKN